MLPCHSNKSGDHQSYNECNSQGNYCAGLIKKNANSQIMILYLLTTKL